MRRKAAPPATSAPVSVGCPGRGTAAGSGRRQAALTAAQCWPGVRGERLADGAASRRLPAPEHQGEGAGRLMADALPESALAELDDPFAQLTGPLASTIRLDFEQPGTENESRMWRHSRRPTGGRSWPSNLNLGPASAATRRLLTRPAVLITSTVYEAGKAQ